VETGRIDHNNTVKLFHEGGTLGGRSAEGGRTGQGVGVTGAVEEAVLKNQMASVRTTEKVPGESRNA